MHSPKVEILLATYNGQKYISEQIESIINQTYTNWELYIRDDNSNDNTVGIIKNYCNKDSRIHLIEDSFGNIKSVENFSALLQHVKNKDAYTMFSDQDDVWLSEKIESTLNQMLNLEKIYSDNFPLLVYTNFSYVDQSLKPIKSKKNFSTTKIKDLKLAHLLAQNPAYGCTMMINKRLVEMVGFIPKVAENHDHWIALVAAAFGKIFYLPHKTILYRQHGKNISTQHDFNSLKNRIQRILKGKNFEDINYKTIMAKEFKKIYYEHLSLKQLRLIDNFIDFTHQKTLKLFVSNIKNGLRRQTASQTILFYLTIILNKQKEKYN